MRSLLYEKEDEGVSPLWVRLMFGCLKVIYCIRWCVVQFGKTLIWLPWALREILQDDLGPDPSRILTQACFMTAFFEVLIGGITIFAVGMHLPVTPIVVAGIVVYLLTGILARCGVNRYGILT